MGLDRILRNPEILQITGVSNATIWRWIKDETFPAPVRLGPNSVGWRESAIREWLKSREPAFTPGGTQANGHPDQEGAA